MKEADRKKRNTDRLLHLHAPFRVRIERIIKVLEEGGLRPRIQDGWRSPEAQLAAYNGGYSKLKFGFHNCVSKTGDPEGLAVDMLDDKLELARTLGATHAFNAADPDLTEKVKEARTRVE